MALVVYWYDFICFGIVVAAYIGSLWILWRKEGASRCDDNTIYESLLAAQADGDGFVRATHKAHVGSNQLWSSCWKGVHPGCLLLTRFLSFVAMAVFLSWDILDWDANKEGLAYWLRWEVPVCALIILVPTSLTSCLIKKAKAKPLFLDDLWTPCWRKLNPVWLLIYRAFAFLCLAFMFEAAVALDGAFAFYFYTQWTFTLVMVYFAVLGNGDICIWMLGLHKGTSFRKWGETCGGAVLLTDIVFWCVIVPFLSDAHLGLNTLIACMHTLNAVFVLLDTALNSLLLNYHLALQPFPWFRIAYFIQWSCLYCVFQWVIHACGFTWWPYPFLELDTPWAPLWYFVLALVHIPCYGLYVLIVEAKNSILPTLFPRAFIRSY
ncbi:protein rolling protein [Citrus sinensis]|nr:protein rolling protein [Citrus sinensis]